MAFEVIRGDVTTMPVDAIVNAANTTLLGEASVGRSIRSQSRVIGGLSIAPWCKTGEAKITPGFKLPAKFVIHTPVPFGVVASIMKLNCSEVVIKIVYD